jgi:RNA polymerase sigma factor (sigma-70 family)
MLKLSKIARIQESHEEVFLGRYARLRSWALQLSSHDRDQAEDLLHDAYIQFNLAQPDLDSINNLDGYLYRLLRNLHLSQVRRSQRQGRHTLSIVDYDSAEIGLRSSDPRQQIRLQDELRQVCQYACDRKDTSKAGSVLILRFLHGYYPREIAQVTRTTRPAVEERLRIARNEARQYLKDPNSLHFLHGTAAARNPIAMGFARATEELLSDLRQAVFDSRQGTCLTPPDLASLYSAEVTAPIDQPTLAHLASCPQCLDAVNGLLNLPPLIERFPTDMIGTDKGAKPKGGDDGGDTGGAGGAGASESELRNSRRRAKEVFEHRPAELCVSVNGYVLATQNVGAEFNEQTLNINVAEKIDFVEVLGEQDTRLLFLSIEELPPGGPHQQSVRVELSDQRTLEATLTFDSPWPTLQVLYHDPLRNVEPATQADLVQETARPELASSPPAPVAAKKPRANAIVRAWRWFSNSGLRLRPATVTAVLSLILIAALLIVRVHVPAVSAAELLQRSTVAEEAMASSPEVVIHRTINLEERASNSPEVISRRRIEVWQSAAQGIKLRRIYDEQNNLIAGEWSKADGVSTVYRPGAKPQARTSPDVAARAILDTGEFWRLDASAKSFDALVGPGQVLTVQENSETYELNYQGAAAGSGNRLVRATLTLHKSSLLATEQTLTVDRNGEVRELRFVEAGLARTPAGSIAPGVFQPDPELLGTTSDGRLSPSRKDLLHNESAGPGAAEVSASPELEIEVTYLLNRIKANLGEQVSMSRTGGGTLRVEALVETEGRKGEILRALGPIINNPAVKVDVRTVAEAARQARTESRRSEMVQEIEVPNGRIPADPDLRAYFSARLVGNEAIEREIDRYAARVMNHSRQALLQASALKRLVDRFSPAELGTLSPEARAKWVGMIREHTDGYRREVGALRQELRSVFGSRGGSEEGGESDPVAAADRLMQLSYANDDAVRSAFTISADDRTLAGIRSEQFWRRMTRAERLAALIESAYQK